MAENIDIVVRLRDIASQKLVGVEKGIRGLGRAASAVAGTVARLAVGFTALAAAATTAAIAGSIKVFSDFDDTMRAVGAVTNATQKDMEALTAVAEKMGSTTKFTAAQSADGLRLLGMAGLDVNESISALPGVLDLATAGGIELGSAADIATNVLSGFGLEVDKLGRVNDVLVKTFTSSNSSLQELGEGFKYIGPIAASAGGDFEDVVAALGKLHDAGIKGSQAGTVLRSSISRLLDPSKETEQTMQKLGQRIGQTSINVKDANGDFVGFADLIKQLEASGADTTDMIQLFGQEAGPGMAALLKVGGKELEKFIEELRESGGTSQRISKQMSAGIGGATRSMRSALESVQIAIGKAVNKDTIKIINRLANAFRKTAQEVEEFTKTEDFRLWRDVVFAAIDTVAFALDKLISSLKIVTKVLQAAAYATSGEWDSVQRSLQEANAELRRFYGFADEEGPTAYKVTASVKDSITVLNKQGELIKLNRKEYAEYLKERDKEKSIGKSTTTEKTEAQITAKVAPSAEAQIKAEMVQLQAIIDKEMAALDTRYELGEVELKQYFQERKALIEESVNAEIEELQRVTDAESDPDKRLANQARIFAAREQLNARLLQLDAERIQAEKEYEEQKISEQETLNESKLAIEQVFRDQKARLAATEGGLLEAEFAEEIAQLQERQNKEMQILQENKATQAQINELHRQQELEKEKVAQDQWRRLMEARADIAQSVAGSLSDIFRDMYELTGKQQKEFFYLSKAASIAQATINIAQGITKAIGVGGYYGIFLGSAVAAAGAVQIAKIASTSLASGGEVPGHSPHKKADNIRANLTAGEWVHPVDAVDYYGKDVMEAMRRKMIPKSIFSGFSTPNNYRVGRLNYAAGGQVAAGPSGGGKAGGVEDQITINNNNFLDPNTFSDYMRSTAGEKDVWNVLTNRPHKLKQIVFAQ